MEVPSRWTILLRDRNLYIDPNVLGTAVKLSIVARSPREQHTFASDVADGGVDGADHVVVLGRYGGTMKAPAPDSIYGDADGRGTSQLQCLRLRGRQR